MDHIQVTPAVLPVTSQHLLIQPMMKASKSSGRTPFSTVAPAQFLRVSRLQIQQKLETIHEEGTAEGDDESSPVPLAAFFSSQLSACFLEVNKPSSSYESNMALCQEINYWKM
ncbi:hypothetical protein PVL29_013307 [Vitis rotundifolia]|uniref:Uncharacterized protein n=1 Tax=Vitis rotundifolia TaxID=103349 RepID=A0AA38ZLI6_VITRO|nr:hypothetical protein PVL29_013307 [Vitis rotundifolia]